MADQGHEGYMDRQLDQLKMFLVYAGLAVTPFLVLRGYDTRWPKEYFALAVALCLSVLAVNTGALKPLSNKWLSMFVAWSYLCIWFAPVFRGMYASHGVSVDGLWNYKACFYILVYFLALSAISSIELTLIDAQTIVKIMAYASFVMAGYCFLQHFGIEQFFTAKPIRPESLPESPNMIGTMGQTTVVAPFILLGMPLMVYLKKYWHLAFMGIVLLMTRSDTALVALVASTAYYFCHGNIRKGIVTTCLILASGAVLWYFWPLNSNGRFGMWGEVLFDMTHPVEAVNRITYFLTGWGPGAFAYLFSVLHGHQSIWASAHNEYLSVFYGTGAVGVFLFGRALWHFMAGVWSLTSPLSRCLVTSFVGLCVCAAGTFVWHLGVYCFYTIVIVGLLNNLLEGKKCQART